MNAKKERYYDIITGPNKDALFDACKYACNDEARIPISFTVAFGYTTPVGDPGCAFIPMYVKDFRIVGIENEDGSGDSFNLRGDCKADLKSFHGTATYKYYRFRAYYNARRRSGCIIFLD